MKEARKQCTVGIVSAAYFLPQRQVSVEDIFKEEGLKFDSDIMGNIGIERVHVFEGSSRSLMALEAAKECLLKAGVKAGDIDVVVDFSVMPQDYVVPSWCMSNKIQYELGATKAFNLGFGGGGATNILVGLRFVASLINTGEVNTALLISSDVAISGNRVINQGTPFTVLGDGASALLVGKNTGSCEILGIELWSDGGKNDVMCVPGGGLRYPDRLDLYRLRIDAMYSGISTMNILKDITERTANKYGVNLKAVNNFIYPNISEIDHKQFSQVFGLSENYIFRDNRRHHGHMHGTDIVINISQIIDAQRGEPKKYGVVCSHGWGFLYGAMMVRV